MSFKEEPEMTDCTVDCQKLMVKCAVPLLGWRELSGKVTTDHPSAAEVLPQWQYLMHLS